jgi:hypothetical protein
MWMRTPTHVHTRGKIFLKISVKTIASFANLFVNLPCHSREAISTVASPQKDHGGTVPITAGTHEKKFVLTHNFKTHLITQKSIPPTSHHAEAS